MNPIESMDFGEAPFKIKVLNNGKIVKNMGELVEAAGEYVWGAVWREKLKSGYKVLSTYAGGEITGNLLYELEA